MIEKQAAPLRPEEPEKTYIKGLSLHSFAQGRGAGRVDTKNGRIIRIRPLHSAGITAEYYNSTGTLIGTERDIVRKLGPGKAGAFEVVYSGERRWDIKDYRIVSLRQI